MTSYEKKAIDRLRNNYLTIEVAARELAEKAYCARQLLDRLSGPAPSGGGKKGLTGDEVGKLLLQRRKTITQKCCLKKKAAVKTAT